VVFTSQKKLPLRSFSKEAILVPTRAPSHVNSSALSIIVQIWKTHPHPRSAVVSHGCAFFARPAPFAGVVE